MFIDGFLFGHSNTIALWLLPITWLFLAILEYLLKDYKVPVLPHSHFVVIKFTINTYSWHQKQGQMWMMLRMFMNSKACSSFLNALMVGTDY
jgi:hypothetical protein